MNEQITPTAPSQARKDTSALSKSQNKKTLFLLNLNLG